MSYYSDYTSQPDNSYEQAICDRYSTPGLRRNILTKYGKQFQLDGLKIDISYTREIIDELYPEGK